jgi:hypothetical protein
MALAALLMMHSAARTRRGRLVHHHLPERGNGRARHLLQSSYGLPEGGAAGFPISLLELRFLLPAQLTLIEHDWSIFAKRRSPQPSQQRR